MRLIRWILFGSLDYGLVPLIVLGSAVIAGVAYISGYYAATFLHNNVSIVLGGSLVIAAYTVATLIIKYRFSATTASVVGFGAFCWFWVAVGGSSEVALILVGSYCIMRGFAEGPAHEHRI